MKIYTHQPFLTHASENWIQKCILVKEKQKNEKEM